MPVEFIALPTNGHIVSFFDIRKYFTYGCRPIFTDSMNFLGGK